MHPKTAVNAFFAARPNLHAHRLIVAVSGGQDSVALAHALTGLAPAYDLHLYLAHLDHGLRPDAAQDALLVERFGRALGLEVFVERRDVAAYARAHGQSIEEAARVVRYAFLADVAHHVGAAGVVTGHTADDQAETVLLRLIRGAGPLGLVGMRPDRLLYVGPARRALRILRPLLETTREETRAYCAEHALAYVEDPSNVDVRFARNRVRHEVLPVLARLNPAIRDALRRTSAAAAELADMVEREAEQAWSRLARVAPGGVGFPADGLRALPRPVQVALLMRAATTLDPAASSDLGARHLDAAVALLAADGPQREVHWPGGLRVQRVGVELWLGVRPTPPALRAEGYELPIPGTVDLPSGAQLSAELRAAPCDEPLAVTRHVELQRAAFGERAIVRGPRPGDRLRPRGLGGTKKVQDILTDAKVPRADRAAVPVVVGRDGPVWVVGYALHEPALTEAQTASGAEDRPIVCLHYVEAARRLEEGVGNEASRS